ncbi:FtsX-like permease family protein [Streptomyces indicus]|uniref:Putative ABC transport system permease protein n=1 Tax=Streptomyces indicus TaxID=417292 RepID=A0A1G9DEG3_9ACTN|nr:FtsX-like permease family protein [Streptomyces indicus]SDK62255.1 putative ABC transport system permease protein [Streptomyces indicus]
MNFVKRAGLSLVARKGKTALLLGIFLVVCVLLLGGFLLEGATARQEAEAQRRIGVDVTVRADRLTAERAGRLAKVPGVQRYNPLLRGVPRLQGGKLVRSDAPRPPDSRPERDGPRLIGLRDSELLLDFATGRSTLVEGRPLTPQDAGHDRVLIGAQLAELNGLAAGDLITLASPDGKHRRAYEVVGVHRDGRAPVPDGWLEPSELPANQIYAPLGALADLGLGSPDGRLDEAVFRLGSPEQAEQLHAAAQRLLGDADFRFDVNDKAYRDQVQPLRRVGAFAGTLVWLIAGAGTVVLGLIVALTIRERRDELGMLLSLGERKWKLIGQHTVEVAAVALPALALAALAGAACAGTVSELLPGHTASAGALLPAPELRLTAADLGRVAGLGVGIALVSTVLPGIGILRLHPRSILAATD